MTNKAIFKIGATYTPIIDTSANTAARTYTMPDKTMTVAGADDVAAAEAAAKAYADSLVVGLLDDRGNYDASGNTFPASGGSGADGAIMKGDIWRISVAGQLGGVQVAVDDWVRALADTPGQTAANWALNSGGLSDQMVYVGTWASRPAASSVVSGSRAFVTDVGYNGSAWKSNGSEWFPLAPIPYFTSIDSYGRAPSGTINTGSSGNITFGTAAPRTYSEGFYVYLPSIATTPAITAGFYWCVMSNTTTGTLYASNGGSAINFTGGASYTGVTTAVSTPSNTLKGGVLGNYRRLRMEGQASLTNNANTKNTGFTFGGNTFVGTGATSTAGVSFGLNVQAKGSSLQVQGPSTSATINGAPSYSSIDTTADQTFYLTLASGSTATDWWIVDWYSITLYPR